MLEKQESVSEDQAAERIAQDTAACFKKGSLVSPDPNDLGCVVFWVKAMTSHIIHKHQVFTGEQGKFWESLDAYAAQYFRFVCTRLMEVDKINEAKRVAQEMQRVLTLPGCTVFSAHGVVMMDLLLGAKDQWQTKADELPLAVRHELFRSKLWNSVQVQQQLSKVQELQVLTKGDKVSARPPPDPTHPA